MGLGDKLKKSRMRSALSQSQVASVLGVKRELISMWENDQRTPSLRQLEEMAQIYQVSLDYLMGEAPLEDSLDRELLYRGMQPDIEQRVKLDKWLKFLDEWTEFVENLGEEDKLTGLRKPPRKLDKGQVTDSRKAPTLAMEVRDYYSLGRDAIPNLYAFLDNLNVLVYRAALGQLSDDTGISGAFYNHPKLGYCILVNANTSFGRQAFTLAHEFAHALYHYPSGGIISRLEDLEDPKERFANAFAAHLLVPGKELRRLVDRERWGRELDGYEALELASFFRVSYATLLYRLLEEKLMDWARYNTLKGYSPKKMAKQLNLDPEDFEIPEQETLYLERYPIPVIERVWHAVEGDELSMSQAADLLDVPQTDLQWRLKLFSHPPEATEEERRQHDEFSKSHLLGR